MIKRRLEIIRLEFGQTQHSSYALIMQEVDGIRTLPIIIGGFEAQAIAIVIERITPPRPLTHDLFKNFLETFSIKITEVVIHKFEKGVFYSKIVATDGNVIKEIDSRTSDAVALALRFSCPIYTTEDILTEVGLVIKNEDVTHSKSNNDKEEEENELSYYTEEELEEMLKNAIEKEEYEKASQIRDELKRRKEEF